jgi:ribosome maturation factor RimP
MAVNMTNQNKNKKQNPYAVQYCDRATALAEPLATQLNYELYDIEYVKEGSDYILRIYIDKPGGVNIIDCEQFSRAIAACLDEDEFIKDTYLLEVSSPGLGRTLKKEKHLQKSLGSLVDVKCYKPDDNGQKTYSGTLQNFDSETITLLDGEQTRILPRTNIAKIQLTLDF